MVNSWAVAPFGRLACVGVTGRESRRVVNLWTVALFGRLAGVGSTGC